MPIRLVLANLAVKWGGEFEPIAECLTKAGQPEAHAYHALLNFGCSLLGRHGDWMYLKCGTMPVKLLLINSNTIAHGLNAVDVEELTGGRSYALIHIPGAVTITVYGNELISVNGMSLEGVRIWTGMVGAFGITLRGSGGTVDLTYVTYDGGVQRRIGVRRLGISEFSLSSWEFRAFEDALSGQESRIEGLLTGARLLLGGALKC
jgi:hypothetical protein